MPNFGLMSRLIDFYGISSKFNFSLVICFLVCAVDESRDYACSLSLMSSRQSYNEEHKQGSSMDSPPPLEAVAAVAAMAHNSLDCSLEHKTQDTLLHKETQGLELGEVSMHSKNYCTMEHKRIDNVSDRPCSNLS